MAPVRRYLRITKYSVLECRIYVDNPALVSSWLLHPRDPALPRVMESVRPLVVPKLMEERERARQKGAKKKGAIRDVVVEADFEVALFLTETASTRHSLLYKHRRARDKTQTRLVSNSRRLTGTEPGAAGPEARPIDVDAGGGADGGSLHVDLGEDGGDDADADDQDIVLTAGPRHRPSSAQAEQPPNLLREDSDEEPPLPLDIIPDIRTATQRPKRRRRQQRGPIPVRDSDEEAEDEENDDDQESLFASEDDEDDDDDDGDGDRPPAKRARVAASTLESATTALDQLPGGLADGDGDGGKKKKIVMDVVYEGFAIYGRVLCLVVKRRGGTGARGAGAGSSAPARSRTLDSMLTPPQSSSTASSSAAAAAAAAAPAATSTTPAASAAESQQPGGLASMENWIASTQMPAGAEDEDEDEDGNGDGDGDGGV